MPKYKNNTEFIRPLQVNGKRIALKPNEVVFSERELDLAIFSFLEKVDDKVQVSQVKELKPQKISMVDPKEVQSVKQKVTSLEEKLNATPEQLQEMRDKIETILKRLELMKNAVATVSQQQDEIAKSQEELKSVVHNIEEEVYEKGAIIIEGLEEPTKPE